MKKTVFKNLSQLKKGLQVGMKFELTNKIKDFVHVREVVDVQTNGFYATGDDVQGRKQWVAYPKAGKCEFLEDKFVFDGLLEYRYI
ncbi:hypothetical protein [Paenibacillus taichungensis]